MMTYGEKIAHLRKSKGMTQEDLGKVLNVTYQAVSKWERGESLPDFPTISQIAKFFEVPLDYFEEGGEERLSATAATAEATVAVNNSVNNIAGVCTVCGKMLKEDEVFSSSPKIICKTCAERQKQAEIAQRNAAEERAKAEKLRRVTEQLGRGVDLRLIICIIAALAATVLLMVLVFSIEKNNDNSDFYSFLLLFVPIATFGLVQAGCDLVCELRDIEDGSEGYSLKLSLIVAGAFSLVHIILFLIIYFVLGKEPLFLVLIALGAVVPFTFISQMMWGSVLKAIFTCGGFTFKLPGFIFSLTPDSILWMIVTKVILGALAIFIFIATTVLLALVAIFGSVITFIPCIIAKTVKDKKALSN